MRFISDFFSNCLHGLGLGGNAQGPDINPATGLPMVGGTGGVDVGGNAFGTSWMSGLLGGAGHWLSAGCANLGESAGHALQGLGHGLGEIGSVAHGWMDSTHSSGVGFHDAATGCGSDAFGSSGTTHDWGGSSSSWSSSSGGFDGGSSWM
jgi:hypothetical protein